MNTSDLIDHMSEKTELSKTECKDLFDKLVSVMHSYFENETGVLIPGFGTFNVREKEGRQAFNPASKEYMLLPRKLVLNFTPASQLKKDLK
jgi:DNA-binding protein HU-beta